MSLMPSKKVAALAAFAFVAPAGSASAQAPLRGPQWPLTLENAKPPAPDAAVAEAVWSEAEISAAQARCNAVVPRYDAVVTPMAPIRDGDCGTAYPVQLTSIGKVALSQPAILNCDMVAVLGDWMKLDVQPAAKQLLGQRVTGIEILSSYSCRNAYGRKRTRLSEHGRANALDIKGFDLEHDRGVDLLADWGMTARDIAAKIAAAEKAARKLAEAAAKAKAEAEAQARKLATAHPAKQPYITSPRPSLAEPQAQQRGLGLVPSADGFSAFRGFMGTVPKGEDGDERPSSVFIWGQASRLGGPKAPKEGVPAPSNPNADVDPRASLVDANGHTPRQRFLREIYASACKRFGTALGPEANEAHRNHFHIDLADRGGRGSYCE